MKDTTTESSRDRSDGVSLSSVTMGYLVALAFVAIAGVTAMVLRVHLGLREPGLIFLLNVLLTATVTSLGPSLLAAVASVLVYDFFFTVPYHSFTMHDPQDVLSVTVFLVVAVVTSHLTTKLRSETADAHAREERTNALYAFTRELAAAVQIDDLLAIVVRHIGNQFQARTIVSLPNRGGLEPRAAFPPGASLPVSEKEAASFAWAEGRSAPMALHNALGERWAHLSIGTIRGEVAVLSLNFPRTVSFSRENEQLLDAFTQQAGVALERALIAAGPAGPSPLR
jgi:two-component system, OmpR family, sensor histidine kinase KdpD